MRAPRSSPPRYIGNGSDNAANLRASILRGPPGTPDESADFGGGVRRSALMDKRGPSRLRIVTFVDAFEQRGREIALARVRQHSENDRARRRFFRNLASGRERAARGNAAENAFALRKRAR